MIQKSLSLEYQPASEPLHISKKYFSLIENFTDRYRSQFENTSCDQRWANPSVRYVFPEQKGVETLFGCEHGTKSTRLPGLGFSVLGIGCRV